MTIPAYGSPAARSGKSGPARSGTGAPGDPTNEPGQYPATASDAIFGGPLPMGTGAPGTSGGGGASDDTTVEAGQTTDSFTGLPESDIDSTGAPGTSGAMPRGGAGSAAVNFTREGSFDDGAWDNVSVRGDVGGPADWTQANASGYGTPGPKLPGMAEPQAGVGPFQPGSGGRVLRGGRAVAG
jgi:hypothetical protein